MEKKERRRERRISAEKLPPVLREFIVHFENSVSERNLKATTIDAGVLGISILVPINVFKIKDYQITLRTLDGSFSITDDIVYIKALTPETSRVSILFSSETDLRRYKDLLQGLL